jgi:hypothetical protein
MYSKLLNYSTIKNIIYILPNLSIQNIVKCAQIFAKIKKLGYN